MGQQEMSTSHLNGDRMHPSCSYDDEKMHELTAAVQSLTNSVQTLTHYYKEMTRWLLIVVCVIALGKELLSVTKSLINNPAQASDGRN